MVHADSGRADYICAGCGDIVYGPHECSQTRTAREGAVCETCGEELGTWVHDHPPEGLSALVAEAPNEMCQCGDLTTHPMNYACPLPDDSYRQALRNVAPMLKDDVAYKFALYALGPHVERFMRRSLSKWFSFSEGDADAVILSSVRRVLSRRKQAAL